MTEPEAGTPEFWAARTPDAPAIIDGDSVVTYGEWNTRADAVAEALTTAGLSAGDRLGMRFRLGAEWFILQRALQKLGVAQVAVSWKLTPAEAAYILRDSGAAGLACNDADPTAWTELDIGHLITVGQERSADWLRIEDLETTTGAPERFGPARTNMVTYTSGTTGTPRGVLPPDPAQMDFERVLRYGASVASCPPNPECVVSLLTLPVHHAAGPAMAAAACAKGGVVVLLDPFDPTEALRLIERHGVQTWTAVPTMVLRIQALPNEVLRQSDLSSLESLMLGAAVVPQSLKEWVVGTLGDRVLWESYGCSEAGLITYCDPAHQLTKPGTSGLPFDGVEIEIVGDDWERLPPGETGEIAVSTPVVFSGYIGSGSPDDSIVRDGFYRTGDVGHVDEDGFLFITDRAKDMIVAGGVNIYPAEIEKAIVAHPDVVDAAVIGVPDDDYGEQPMAFVIPTQGAELTPESLLDHLGAQLAKYKLPRRFEFRSELPRNPMGKVQKNELRVPYWSGKDRNV